MESEAVLVISVLDDALFFEPGRLESGIVGVGPPASPLRVLVSLPAVSSREPLERGLLFGKVLYALQQRSGFGPTVRRGAASCAALELLKFGAQALY